MSVMPEIVAIVITFSMVFMLLLPLFLVSQKRCVQAVVWSPAGKWIALDTISSKRRVPWSWRRL